MVCVQQPEFFNGGVLGCGERAAEHTKDVGSEGEGGEGRRERRGGTVAVGCCDDDGEGGEGRGDLSFDC